MVRSLATVCMAAWLMGTICMAIVATQNFFTIDRLLASQPNPEFAAGVQKLGAGEAREFLRYLSSELNRLYFLYWNVAQLAIGIIVLWLVTRLPSHRSGKVKWSLVVMIAIVLFMTIGLMPQILSVGRGLDFVPRDPPPPALRTFGLLHSAYTVLDLVKLIVGIVVTIWLQRSND